MIDAQELETVASVAHAMLGRHPCMVNTVANDDGFQSSVWRLGQELLADVKQGKPLAVTVDRLELLARYSAWITLSPDLAEQDPVLICSQLSDGEGFARMLRHLLAQRSNQVRCG